MQPQFLFALDRELSGEVNERSELRSHVGWGAHVRGHVHFATVSISVVNLVFESFLSAQICAVWLSLLYVLRGTCRWVCRDGGEESKEDTTAFSLAYLGDTEVA